MIKNTKDVTFTLQIMRLREDKHNRCVVLGRNKIIYKYSYPKFIT